VIGERFDCLDWPPHSPDLSPVEMMWSMMKDKLKGQRFDGPDQLFDALVRTWWSIDQATIDRLVGSFEARCEICIKYNGACLNGHWGEVHKAH
jgi:hypothetical protein